MKSMKIDDMVGQWFGTSHPNGSDTKSFIIVNIEARSPNNALMIGMEAPTQLRKIADATIEVKGDKLVGKTSNFQIYDHNIHAMVPLPLFYQRAGIKVDGVIASEAEYVGTFDGEWLSGTWENNASQTGTFSICRSFSQAIHNKPISKRNAGTPMKWEDFKKHISAFRSKGRILFRGQHSNSYPLRTSFHRKKRNNIPRYLLEDVFRLRHQINAISTHVYQQTPEDLQGLLSLAQHHGFPTPLLDWTESPYVAAFFAFDCVTEQSQWYSKNDREPVRIFTFDLDAWLDACRNLPRVLAQSLNDPCPDVAFFHPPAHNNPRYYPQQSMAAFSTIDNIEDFIAAYELTANATFLTRIDILASERKIVEEELRFMGITPATLFPGFEGACKSLRAQLF